MTDSSGVKTVLSVSVGTDGILGILITYGAMRPILLPLRSIMAYTSYSDSGDSD